VVDAGTAVNVIVATADFAASVPGAVRIDHVTPRPGVGWTYRSNRWRAPTESEPPQDAPLGAGIHGFPT
jgi:hypothetical protein